MKARAIQLATLCALAVLAAPVAARLTEINIAAVEPFAEGASFGSSGPYERVVTRDPRAAISGVRPWPCRTRSRG